ncbi:MAG: MFS transporter [Chloroflexota bacterium]|nr:MFS transporter [Chloroflexota bacterium]
MPRNVWAASLTSFFMDVSSEMVINILPLFLANVLGARIGVIGLIEGIAEATASLMKVFSGWLSDRLRARKWLAVAGYGISTLAKPFFYVANSWTTVMAARWGDRVGKMRTAPRDALIADSIDEGQRGLAFGFHRAADTGGAVLGLVIAFLVVWTTQSTALKLGRGTFRMVVLFSLIPAVLAVLSLAIGAREVPIKGRRRAPSLSLKGFGTPFKVLLLIVCIFELGNSSDAFLVLRAQERGLSVLSVLGMLIAFNLVYALLSGPAGAWSDRIGRRRIIVGGWIAYSLIYLGFALAGAGWQVWGLFSLYGVYYGLTFGTTKALVADIVRPAQRGTAYGVYNATLGLLDFPASLIAGVLWQGVGRWKGFGPSAPFAFGAMLALIAALLMALWLPRLRSMAESSSA